MKDRIIDALLWTTMVVSVVWVLGAIIAIHQLELRVGENTNLIVNLKWAVGMTWIIGMPATLIYCLNKWDERWLRRMMR